MKSRRSRKVIKKVSQAAIKSISDSLIMISTTPARSTTSASAATSATIRRAAGGRLFVLRGSRIIGLRVCSLPGIGRNCGDSHAGVVHFLALAVEDLHEGVEICIVHTAKQWVVC